MSCNHVYEVWQWMVKNGFYPLIPASQTDILKQLEMLLMKSSNEIITIEIFIDV